MASPGNAVAQSRHLPHRDWSKVEEGVELILHGLGVDIKDRNYVDTPERYMKALREMFEPPTSEWNAFEEEYSDFILLRGHEMWSLCPHHLFPVRFRVSLAYIPGGNVLGLSKLARLMHDCNRRPLLQEGFTKMAIDKVYEVCKGVQGAACLVEGKHGCLAIRGVKSDAEFTTYKLRGAFETNQQLENRFFELARR